MKDVPEEYRMQIEKLLDEHPEFLMTLAQELRDEMQKGKGEQDAFLAVAERHKDTLQQLLGKKNG